MRVLVSGAGGFVGAHLDAELRRAGHEPLALPAGAMMQGATWVRGTVDAVVQLVPEGTRELLDLAWLRGARRAVLLSTVGADSRSPRPQLRDRGRAEEIVRACGLPWAILRPEILWGPGDVFTNEIAHLLTHLPFIPVARRGPVLDPVFAGDAARALVEMLASSELPGTETSLLGPEAVSYGSVVVRVAEALGMGHKRKRELPSSIVRAAQALEERWARRPRESRALLDRLVAHEEGLIATDPERTRRAETRLTVDALQRYLVRGLGPAEQLLRLRPAG
jgi:NADH dehydrogenase